VRLPEEEWIGLRVGQEYNGSTLSPPCEFGELHPPHEYMGIRTNRMMRRARYKLLTPDGRGMDVCQECREKVIQANLRPTQPPKSSASSAKG